MPRSEGTNRSPWPGVAPSGLVERQRSHNQWSDNERIGQEPPPKIQLYTIKIAKTYLLNFHIAPN